MTWWPFHHALALDFETTGTDPETCRVVTAAVARLSPTESRTTTSVINPGVPIPEEAAAIHGWTTERVEQHGKPPADELQRIATAVTDALDDGVPLIVANAPFDLTVLRHELARHQVPHRLDALPVAPVLDPLVIDKRIDRYRPGKRRLADLCETYRVSLDQAHDAAADALGAARVVWRIGQLANTPADQLAERYASRRYPDEVARAVNALAALSLDALHAAQAEWYREQKDDLRQYFLRKAAETSGEERAGLEEKAAGVTTDWPMR